MFTVSCHAGLVWHPAVHHCLLLLRALRQSHTLVIERKGATGARPFHPVSLSQSGSHLSIIPPDFRGKEYTSGGNNGETVEGSSLTTSQSSLMCIRDPQHLLYFFLMSSSSQRNGLEGQIQPYLNSVVVGNQVLRSADDVLVALNVGGVEAVRQVHSTLMDRIAALDASVQKNEGSGQRGSEVTQELECLSTWPLFTTIQFLVEECGLPLGPFPRIAEVYSRLRESIPVQAHKQLIQRTLKVTKDTEGFEEQPPLWTHQGLLREIQRQIAEYTADPPENAMAGVVGEKGPLRARVSGARLGLQRTPARTPWTMQGYGK